MKNAIFLIATCAILHWASAQNITEKTSILGSTDSQELAEQERIAQERSKEVKAYDVAKAECYQRFAVENCLTAERNQHLARMADLKRQDLSLGDVQRKRRGAEQLLRTEARTSNAQQEQTARQRGAALANEAERQKRQAAQPAAQQAAALAAQGRSQTSARKQTAQQNKATERQKKAAQAAQAKARSAQRAKDADTHRANVQNRQANSKKKPSASLPVPAN